GNKRTEATPETISKIPFKAFVKELKLQDSSEAEVFWKDNLKGFDQPVELSVKRSGQGRLVPSVKFHVPFPDEVRVGVEEFSRNHKLTPASLFYSAWGLLLQRYNNVADVVFGTTVSGRDSGLKGIEKVVGLFINTPPLRVRALPDETTLDCLRRIDDSLKTRAPYENSSLVKIKGYSPLASEENLFDTIVVVENYPLSPCAGLNRENSLLTVESWSNVEMTNFDLMLVIKLF
ncbi:MAG: B12-binding domain-containing radical SAM protein, partial [bacterium]|nr:B12-binding domain-containing radical SAM protein [bacterium]